MNLFLLSAGLGTRLKPITNRIPKPLISILGVPMIQYPLSFFANIGFSEAVVNTFHLKTCFNNIISETVIPIRINEEKILMGTAGGLKNSEYLFSKNEPIVVMNGDIFYNINFKPVLEYYKTVENPLALMVLKPNKNGNVRVTKKSSNFFNKNRETSSFFDENERYFISKLRDKESTFFDSNSDSYLFTGLQIISSDIFNFLVDEPSCIVETYMNLIESKRLYAYIDYSDSYWSDIGTLESYWRTSMDFLNNSNIYSGFMGDLVNKSLQKQSEAIKNLKLEVYNSFIGKDISIPKKSVLKNAILLDGFKSEETIFENGVGFENQFFKFNHI